MPTFCFDQQPAFGNVRGVEGFAEIENGRESDVLAGEPAYPLIAGFDGEGFTKERNQFCLLACRPFGVGDEVGAVERGE